MQRVKKWGLLMLSSLILAACAVDPSFDRYSDFRSEGVIVYEEVLLSSKKQVPPLAGAVTTGTARIILENNFVVFNIKVENVPTGDTLTAAHIHLGEPTKNGAVLVGLVTGTDIVFKNNKATGRVRIVDKTVLQLKDVTVPLYINVHSTEKPAGLVRGTLVK